MKASQGSNEHEQWYCYPMSLVSSTPYTHFTTSDTRVTGMVKASQGSNEHEQCCSLWRPDYYAACADIFSLESNSNSWKKAIKA